jgi:ubiquinone/menaquinone biosynthesis C-methylase UbiE
MLKKLLDKIYNAYDQKTFAKEDNVVFNFINGLKTGNNQINYLELGSGLCRFPLIVKNGYKNLNIKCLEKNSDLVALGIKNGLDVICGDVVKMNFADSEFDLVHCSHVVEHLDYEGISDSLDEMFRILKPGGHLIIRSPLMYSGFYFDIDHIRPYPPEAILNYFNNNQQQKVGNYHVVEISRWYRRSAPLVFNSETNIAKIVNYLLKFTWLIFGLPKSKPNGYILILKKI